VLTCTERLFRVIATPDARAEYAFRLEEALRDAMNTRDATARVAIFACLRNVATTEPTVAWLRAVWANQTGIPGLQLAEDDRIVLGRWSWPFEATATFYGSRASKPVLPIVSRVSRLSSRPYRRTQMSVPDS
jgi:hypothetical protein